ncbi:ThiF family adenylyltransferase [Brevibacterium atlanticum]|uniref:ThiF family adenylyltransferase n=1 Tax=Brevibacterium atlanticum TaxID=2697563 RepID=UPI00141EC646|nr:ThiF family adenylyltransferase [Brevibacterium atlanticum]
MTEPRLDSEQRARYARQIRLAGFGETAQQALLESHVFVIGAGGLGAPVLSYLAGVGIGTITVIDPDIVERSNLHRQVIHTEAAIGSRKTDSAEERMRGINSDIEIRTMPYLLTPDNALEVLDGVDIVIDGSDNFATRYLANDACEILGIPLVWGTILGFDGQVAVFDARTGATLRDLYPDVPAPGTVPDCATAGVLGPLCGSIGSAMAMEAIKMLTGIGAPLTNAVAIYDSLDASWERVPVSRRPDRSRVTDLRVHLGDYGQQPASERAQATAAGSETPAGGAQRPAGDGEVESGLGPAQLRWPDLEADRLLVDIREDDEVAAGMVPGAIHIPLDDLLEDPQRYLAASEFAASRNRAGGPDAGRNSGGGVSVALYCRSGVRSARAAAALRSRGIAVSSVSGGYLAYLSQPVQHTSQPVQHNRRG